MLTCYLAGPDVFLPDADALAECKKQICRDHGVLGLHPLDNDVRSADAVAAGALIYAGNRRMMQQADFGIFHLTPFRGPHADAGTICELGLMAGMGKPVFGYTNVTSGLLARIDGATADPQGRWRDPHMCLVEDFGHAENLMISACLAEHSAGLLRYAGGGKLDELGGFRLCVGVATSIIRCATSGGELATDASG